jgi:hypothetical protein
MVAQHHRVKIDEVHTVQAFVRGRSNGAGGDKIGIPSDRNRANNRGHRHDFRHQGRGEISGVAKHIQVSRQNAKVEEQKGAPKGNHDRMSGIEEENKRLGKIASQMGRTVHRSRNKTRSVSAENTRRRRRRLFMERRYAAEVLGVKRSVKLVVSIFIVSFLS